MINCHQKLLVGMFQLHLLVYFSVTSIASPRIPPPRPLPAQMEAAEEVPTTLSKISWLNLLLVHLVRELQPSRALASISAFGAFGALFVILTSPSKHFHYDSRSLLAGSEFTEGGVEP